MPCHTATTNLRLSFISMSAPTKELQNLSIGGPMPAMTRSQAQQERRRRERAERQQRLVEQPRAFPSLSPSADGTITGHTGITYNVRQLTPRSQQAALQGLHAAEFMVDVSREFKDGSYYGFQLRVAESVRVYDPSSSNRRVTCTCDGFNKNPTAAICAHIYVCSPFDSLESSANRLSGSMMDSTMS